MSSTQSHLDTPADGQRTPRTPTSPGATVTRTVAIIKTHALEHRFDIEQRITEAGFEIVKERQMEFDIESDPDTMFDIFGSEYVSFGEGPVWVYVLERRRAVEVWHTLMGDTDPEVARAETSNSLRALYGKSKEQNAVMGSLDAESAEIQIQSIFASSPPFPSSELPDVGSPDPFASYTTGTDDSRQRTTSEKSRSSGSDKPKFRARALPATHVAPDIVPRMSRAASLRAGIVEDKPKRFPATPESLKKTFAGVPGHKRSETIQVASTAPPVVAPRMTRAAALRLGQPVTPTASKIERRASGSIGGSEVFDGIPGHKRRESIQVASTRPPTVTPRSNRSAELRVLKDAASPPSSFQFRSPGSLSRSSSRSSLDVPGNQRPSFATTTRPASAASIRAVNGTNGTPIKTKPPTRPPSTKPLGSSSAVNGNTAPKQDSVADTATPAPASKPKVTVASTGAPTISPRTNKSALLRAAKMALGGGVNGSAKPTVPVKTSTKTGVKVQAPKPIRA